VDSADPVFPVVPNNSPQSLTKTPGSDHAGQREKDKKFSAKLIELIHEYQAEALKDEEFMATQERKRSPKCKS